MGTSHSLVFLHHIVGRNIKHFRKNLDLTQEEAAFNAGISYTYFGQIERGERNATISTIASIAEVLKVKPFELFK